MASVAQTASGRKGFNPDKVTEDIDCPTLIFLPELSCSPCSRLFFFSFTPCPLLFFFFLPLALFSFILILYLCLTLALTLSQP